MRLKDGIWLLPLRGRLAGLRRLVAAVQATEPAARVVAVLDQDDPEILELVGELAAAGWRWLVAGGQATTAEKLNFAVEENPREHFYGFLASDVEPQTAGWGEALAASCPPFGLAFCDDSIHHCGLPTHPCVSGELVRALGWWAYPEACHNGIDVYLNEVALLAGGTVYLSRHLFLHHHPSAGRAAPDALNARAEAWREADRRADALWRAGGFRDACLRVWEARNV